MTVQSNYRVAIARTILGLFMLSSSALADTRVLVRFDETGHYAHKVYRTASTRIQKVLTPSNVKASGADAILRWFNDEGDLLATTRVLDPRATHAPLQAGTTDIAWTVLLEGAYMASGPDMAAQLEISLPARISPQMAAETWLIAL